MQRVASLLLLAGAVLLASWIAAPAAPSPTPPLAAVAATPFDQARPIVAEVSAQLDRLRSRIEATPEFPTPERDPFRFAPRPEPTPKPRPAIVESAAPVEPPAPVLPKLLAIVANEVDGVVVHSAVFSIGDGVRVVKVGETIGTFVLRGVSADVADLADAVTGTLYHVTLH